MATRQQTNAPERFIRIPFPVLFMRVFYNEDEARKLLEIVTRFLIAKGHDIVHAEVVKSEFANKNRFTLSVAYRGKEFGISLHKHTGFQLLHNWDPYATGDKPIKESASPYAGEYFMSHWRVRVPLRLVSIEIEDGIVAEEEEVA